MDESDTEKGFESPSPVQATKPTPTKELTKDFIKNSNATTRTFHPRRFLDWEKQPRELKSKEINKGTYSHGFEARTSDVTDLVECPIQTDPEKYQRTICSLITDKTRDSFADRMQELSQSTSPNILKFRLPMAYWDKELADYYLDRSTGDAAMYHTTGKFWSFKRFDPQELENLIKRAERSGTLKRPPQNLEL
jgi:hypothetical protein